MRRRPWNHRESVSHIVPAGPPLAVFASSRIARRRRPALTLVEVLLVLALLVVVGAVTVPLLSGSLSYARLRHSGDVLRGAWAKARLAAMQAGEPYVFRFEPNGARYQIDRLSSVTAEDAEVTVLAPDDFSEVDYSDADLLRRSLARLPLGVVFTSGEMTPPPQLAAAAAESGLSAPIVFYPDGTTSDAIMQLSNADGASLRVTLRGLTGSSRASEISAEGTP